MSCRSSKILSTIVLSSGLLVACSKGGSSSSATSTTASGSAVLQSVSTSSLADAISTDSTEGNLQVLATNEVLPAGVTDIVVGISAIDIHLKSGDYVSVSATAASLDLADLTNSVSSLVQANIAAGSYDKVRFTFSSIAVTYDDGDETSYDFSSDSTAPAHQFVASLHTAVTLSASSVVHLLLDVGAIAKVHGYGAGACQKPSDHSGLIPPFQLINLDTTGAMNGLVTASSTDSSGNVTSTNVEGAIVTAVLNGVPVASARTDANGNYLIFGLAAGSYQVYVSGKDYATSSASAVAVSVLTTTEEDFTLTAATTSTSTNDDDENNDRGNGPPAPPWDGGNNFDRQ